jgi:hypothetical protein
LRFKSYDHIESIVFFEKIHQYESTKNDFRILSLNQIVIIVEKTFIYWEKQKKKKKKKRKEGTQKSMTGTKTYGISLTKVCMHVSGCSVGCGNHGN